MAGGWVGLLISYKISVDHGVRLATGATVVLVLVAGYLLALVATTVRARATMAKPRAGATMAKPRVGTDLPAGKVRARARIAASEGSGDRGTATGGFCPRDPGAVCLANARRVGGPCPVPATGPR